MLAMVPTSKREQHSTPKPNPNPNPKPGPNPEGRAECGADVEERSEHCSLVVRESAL